MARASLLTYASQMTPLKQQWMVYLRMGAANRRNHWMHRLPRARMRSCHSSHHCTILHTSNISLYSFFFSLCVSLSLAITQRYGSVNY
uniref:Uncharacterized protein n=1 Tax=Arundo donax TaxID=35708 RepID=A0A0A9CJZ3_ARUDO